MKDDFFQWIPEGALCFQPWRKSPRIAASSATACRWARPSARPEGATALEGAGKGRMKVGDLGVHSVDLFVYPLVNSGKRISHSYPIEIDGLPI